MTAAFAERAVPTLLRGLSILRPADQPGPDLATEFGLSAWMFASEIDVFGVRDAMPALRLAVLDVAGIDPRDEPTPLSGRTPRDDILRAAQYLGDLLERAALTSGLTPREIAERAVGLLRDNDAASAPPTDDAADDAPLCEVIPIR